MRTEGSRSPTQFELPAPSPTRGDRLNAAAIGLGVVVGIGGGWAWLATSGINRSDDPGWVEKEKALPLADAYMAAVGLAAAIQMWRGKPSAVGLGIAAGSASTFLGLMDVLHNLEHGKYGEPSADMALAGVPQMVGMRGPGCAG